MMWAFELNVGLCAYHFCSFVQVVAGQDFQRTGSNQSFGVVHSCSWEQTNKKNKWKKVSFSKQQYLWPQLCHCQNWEFLDTANIHLDAVECFWTSRKLITSLWFSVDTCASCTVHPQTTVSICTREKQSWMSKRSFQKFGELMKFLWWKRKCSPDQSENSISLKLPYNLPADSFY